MRLRDLAEKISALIEGNPDCEIQGVAPLATAKKGELTFLLGGHYRQYLPSTKASAVVLKKDDITDCPCNAIIVDNPEVAFAKLLPLFEKRQEVFSGIHPSVVIGSDCEIDENISIAPGCVIGDRVKIGPGSVISANTVIGDRVQIGTNFYAHPNVTLYHDVKLGDRVILHSGVVIGADGFGLANDRGRWLKIPQIGSVLISNDVEVGANSTIDRGALEDTVIEEGVKIDNQVQVAHNVHIGAHTVIAGCVGIAGSAHIGKHCLVGGGACINGHIRIVDQVIISGMAMVTHSINEPGIYSSGTGLQSNRAWRKSVIRFQQLDALYKRLQNLERLQNEQ